MEGTGFISAYERYDARGRGIKVEFVYACQFLDSRLVRSTALIVSVYFGYHDSCATFATRDRILLHLEGERVFRRKHARLSADEMEQLVGIGLSYLGATIDDVEKLLVAKWLSAFDLKSTQLLGREFRPTVTSHHENHIGCVIPAGFDDFVAVVADGGSEDGTTKIYHWKHGNIRLLADLDFEIVTGKFYGTLTQLVVCLDHDQAHQECPGKLMGLAPLGRWSDELATLLTGHRAEVNQLYPDGCDQLREQFAISPDYRSYWTDERRQDLAFTGQALWVQRFLDVIGQFTGISRNIALCGGCALNIGLNEAVRRSGWFENTYVPCVPNDSGQSLGAILFNYPSIRCEYPYLGRSFGSITAFDPEAVIADLLSGHIVAWYQGASEIGPRALGHRSFLGLPFPEGMRERLSVEVKRREPFRPVSPVAEGESAASWFDLTGSSRYMSFSTRARSDRTAIIPAVVHVDGSVRVQTLSRSDNPELHSVLVGLRARGYPPILMNSSLNSPGEPMADTPEDAIGVYQRSGVDVLYVNGDRTGPVIT